MSEFRDAHGLLIEATRDLLLGCRYNDAQALLHIEALNLRSYAGAQKVLACALNDMREILDDAAGGEKRS